MIFAKYLVVNPFEKQVDKVGWSSEQLITLLKLLVIWILPFSVLLRRILKHFFHNWLTSVSDVS